MTASAFPEATEEKVPQSKRHAEQAVQKEARLKELRDAIRNQEDKVEERRKVLATIVRTKGIIYRGPDASALQSHHQLEAEKIQMESQISSLLKYDNEQLMVYAAGLNLPDNVVRTVYPRYQEAKRKLEGLAHAGHQSSSPQVIEQLKEIEGLKQQLDEGVKQLRATLQAQLDVASERLTRQASESDATQAAATKDGPDAQDYVDAKRDFETDQKLLEQMKLKLAEERAKSR
jgi:uncharacterized protein involved in exopolysaccharide biosynthesis